MNRFWHNRSSKDFHDLDVAREENEFDSPVLKFMLPLEVHDIHCSSYFKQQVSLIRKSACIQHLVADKDRSAHTTLA